MIILITGTRKGIGRYLAEHYLKRGETVEGCSRGPSDLDHENYTHHAVDVSDEKQVKGMFSHIRQRHRKLDVLINNAGIASMNHTLLTPGKVFEEILKVNLLGAFLVSREAVKVMKRTSGRIVNFSSIAVPLALEGEAAYASSKAGLEVFTKVLSREVAPWNITCNVVGLSPIKTDLIKGLGEEKMKALLKRMPIQRFGDLAEVAHIVDFLIDSRSSGITGQTIYLGGV